MPNIIIPETLTIEDQLDLMKEYGKYDIAEDDKFVFDSSSVASESYADTDSCIESVKRNIKSPHNPPKIDKLFVSGNCINDCSYCGMRCSKDKTHRSGATEPRELAKIAVLAAKNNGHGAFISSAIYKNPDYTEELILQTVRHMRKDEEYKGFIHAKVMPGADFKLIDELGKIADRISINIELPKSEGYAFIAKQKNKDLILKPMEHIARRIKEYQGSKIFAKSGQTTQMMVGIMHESDRTVINLAQALYKKYGMRRVYYSPFNPPSAKFDFFPDKATPFWRTRRMYQADRLVQLYGFNADELAPESAPNFDYEIDPKAAWALRHLDMFPVEVNKVDYESLIRVPGIGVTNAKRIIELRRTQTITHDILRKLKVSMNRAVYFILCNGRHGAMSIENPDMMRLAISDIMPQTSLFKEIL